MFMEQVSCTGRKQQIRDETCDGLGDVDLLVAPKFKVTVMQDRNYYGSSRTSSIGAVTLINRQSGGGELTYSSTSWPTTSAGGFSISTVSSRKIEVKLAGSDFRITLANNRLSAKFHIDITFASGELDASIPQRALSGCGDSLNRGRLLFGIADLPECAGFAEPFKTHCNIDLSDIDDPELREQILSSTADASQTYQQTANQTISELTGGGGGLALGHTVKLLISLMILAIIWPF